MVFRQNIIILFSSFHFRFLHFWLPTQKLETFQHKSARFLLKHVEKSSTFAAKICWILEVGEVHCFSLRWRFAEAVFVVSRLDSKFEKECKSGRSRQELSNEYLVAKLGPDLFLNKWVECGRWQHFMALKTITDGSLLSLWKRHATPRMSPLTFAKS